MKKKSVFKLFSLVLAMIMATSILTACGNGKEEKANEDKPFKIGLVQYAEHPSLDTIRESFMERIEEWGYDETKISIDYQNGGGEAANLNAICQKFVGDEVDLIVAIATPAAQVAVSAVEGTDIKVVFSAVNDPSDVGLQSPETPEGNITGTSDRIPVSAAVDLALKVNPELKTFGLFYNSGESNSAAAAAEAKAYCESLNIAVVESSVSTGSEIQQVVTDLCGKVDAIFTSTDNSIASNMAVVADVTKTAKVPFYVGADSMVKDGGLAAIGVDYSKLGAETADQCLQIMEGKSVSEIPVKFFETYDTYINQSTLDAVGVKFPEEVMTSAILFE